MAIIYHHKQIFLYKVFENYYVDFVKISKPSKTQIISQRSVEVTLPLCVEQGMVSQQMCLRQPERPKVE